MEKTARLHWLMYGLFYPAVLGTAIVVTLQHVSAQLKLDSVTWVAITAGTFFSLSFASAQGLEKRYGLPAFVLDVAEVLGMSAIFVLLKLIEPPSVAAPALDAAYGVLIMIVLMQLLWRTAMGMKWNTFADLKVALLSLLIAGVFLGPRYDWINGRITAAFAFIAVLYVAGNPYKQDGPKLWCRWVLGRDPNFK